jgi:hypothetical protein
MSLLDAGYPGTFATAIKLPGDWRASWKFTASRLSSEWAKAALPPVARALAVASLLAGVFVIAATGERVEITKPTTRYPHAPSPILALIHDAGSPLDSDFSLDQAARTWARRLAPGDQGDRPGTMRFGAVRVQRSIVERVVKAAKSTGSDPALLMSIADKESSFASSAKASTSSASGLFQFVESTWLKALKTFGWRYGREEEANAIHGEDEHPVIAPQKRAEILQLRDDPYLSAALAAEMLKRDGSRIAEHLGRSLTAGETYLIHFLGPDDAERFMTRMDEAPQASAAELLPKPARANKTIFYKREGRKMKDLSLSEVHEAFEHMMGSRVSRYQDVEAQLPPEAQAYAEPIK